MSTYENKNKCQTFNCLEQCKRFLRKINLRGGPLVRLILKILVFIADIILAMFEMLKWENRMSFKVSIFPSYIFLPPLFQCRILSFLFTCACESLTCELFTQWILSELCHLCYNLIVIISKAGQLSPNYNLK